VFVEKLQLSAQSTF